MALEKSLLKIVAMAVLFANAKRRNTWNNYHYSDGF
jgi:hypothetical protein